MPKRLLDDSLLSSPSLAKCSPRAQDAFPRFLLLMDDFGCSDANPRALLGRGWPLRDDVTERDVWGWLEEYVGVGMACLWTEKERRWVHLTGWFGPHGQRKRLEYDPTTVAGQKGSKRKTPAPPADLVAAVAAGARRDHDGKPPGTDREDEAETVKDSTPARETTEPAAVPVDSRRLPAHAVAVPDAVAGSPPARACLVSPFPPGQDPHPLTTAVLAALYERGLDAAPPGAGSVGRVEAAIAAATLPLAIDRLAAVYADPNAKRPLTFHVEAIRGAKRQAATHGDLGAELSRWQDRLTEGDLPAARAEWREAVKADPEFADAPLGILGVSTSPAYEAIRAFNEKWRTIAEARS
jgi:hypothetical protein